MGKYFPKQELKNIIAGKGRGERIPMMYRFWIEEERFGEFEQQARDMLDAYPNDILRWQFVMPGNYREDPYDPFSFTPTPPPTEQHGYDTNCAIADWDQLDEIIANFPDPNDPRMFANRPECEEDHYLLACWWTSFFERLWGLRGMENALIDLYEYPEEIHKLFDALTNFYCRVIERAAKEGKVDGILTSDDIGTQNGPFFSLEMFREFFKPYYKRIIDCAHANGLEFWLHTCGNIEPFIPEFIEIGLDVLHPIQKYTMDERRIADQYGDKICFWAGFDVQRIIPYGTPEDVRREVRFMIDAYDRFGGRFLLTLGNMLTEDCKIESLHALLDESFNYGLEHEYMYF